MKTLFLKRLLKDFFTVPREGERKEIERGTFQISTGTVYFYIRYDNGFSESVEVFDAKNDYLGIFESFEAACLYCESVYGIPTRDLSKRVLPVLLPHPHLR